MICVSIGERSVEGCLKAIKAPGNPELAEIRIDMLERPDEAGVRRIFSPRPGSRNAKLIATCRPGKLPDGERKALLLAAIGAGAAFVDVEVEAGDAYKHDIAAAAKANGCAVIVSFHDYSGTPGRGELKQVLDWCFESGADIAKIACNVNSEADCARLLGLLDDKRKVAVVGMGARGRVVRVVAPLLGSQLAFASAGRGKETAEGQLTQEQMRKAWEGISGND